MRAWILLGCLLLLPILSDRAFGQDELNARLHELNEHIEIIRKDLDQVTVRLSRLDGEIKTASAQVASFQEQESLAEAELAERTQQREALDRSIADAEVKTAHLKSLYTKRIRTLYMHGNRGALNELARAGNQAMFVRSAYYLSKVREFDASLLNTIAQTLRDTEARRIELDEVIRLQQELKEEVGLQRERLAKQVTEQQALVAELRRERAKRESLLTNLNAQALRLETVLASLTNAGEAPQTKPSKKSKRQQAQSKGFTSYEGDGLAALKGKLPIPGCGNIVQAFGKRAQQGAAARKGVEILCPQMGEVRAVAPGRVIFLGRMPEMSTVLIIDHGKRFYSLYGRLSEAELEKGDEVEAGEILGKTADPKLHSPNLYFEIRNAGIAVDPAAFFEKK